MQKNNTEHVHIQCNDINYQCNGKIMLNGYSRYLFLAQNDLLAKCYGPAGFFLNKTLA